MTWVGAAGLGMAALLSESEYQEFVEQVYLARDQALKQVFPAADTVRTETRRLTSQQITRIEQRMGWKLEPTQYTVYIGERAGQVQGYAVITEEIGKFKPITFIVKVTPDGQVNQVAVMVYRESRGSEVRRARFLNQLKGKSVRSPLRIHRDLINVTGATLSVRAVAAGTKRVLNVIHELYLAK